MIWLTDYRRKGLIRVILRALTGLAGRSAVTDGSL